MSVLEGIPQAQIRKARTFSESQALMFKDMLDFKLIHTDEEEQEYMIEKYGKGYKRTLAAMVRKGVFKENKGMGRNGESDYELSSEWLRYEDKWINALKSIK